MLALLFSDVRRAPRMLELRALQNPNQRQTDILTARATQALARPISPKSARSWSRPSASIPSSSRPSFIDVEQHQPSRSQPDGAADDRQAHLGPRLPDVLPQPGTSINDQIVLLEYDASERVSWMLSRNEDSQTYALEFRVRHTLLMRGSAPRRPEALASGRGCTEAQIADPSVRSRRRDAAGRLVSRVSWPRSSCARFSCPRHCEAAIDDYLGKPVASVRLVIEGRETVDPSLARVVETREGEPLSMAAVRETVTHLFSLGRFDDVRGRRDRRRRPIGSRCATS